MSFKSKPPGARSLQPQPEQPDQPVVIVKALDISGIWVDTSGAKYVIDDDGNWDSETTNGRFQTHTSGTLKIVNEKATMTTTDVEVTTSDPASQYQIETLRSDAARTALIDEPQEGTAKYTPPDKLVITLGPPTKTHSLDLLRDTRKLPTSE